MGSNYGYRPTPQVSANQMAEFSFATAPRRKTIVQEARFPKKSTVARYGIARDCLASFLADDTRSFQHIADATDQLERRAGRADASDWIKQDSQFSLEAVQAFQGAYNRSGLRGMLCRLPQGRLPFLIFGETKVSVAIDVFTRKVNLDGPDSIGGAVFVFSRGEGSSKKRVDRCKIIAGLVYDFCREHRKANGVADTAICFGVDVFGRKSYAPAGTFARTRKQIEASAEEIALRWPKAEPPPDYDGPEPY